MLADAVQMAFPKATELEIRRSAESCFKYAPYNKSRSNSFQQIYGSTDQPVGSKKALYN